METNQIYSSDVAFTPTVKAVQSRKGSRRGYAQRGFGAATPALLDVGLAFGVRRRHHRAPPRRACTCRPSPDSCRTARSPVDWERARRATSYVSEPVLGRSPPRILWPQPSPARTGRRHHCVGARLDEKPALLFELRGVDENELLVSAGRGISLNKIAPAATKLLDDTAPTPKSKLGNSAAKGTRKHAKRQGLTTAASTTGKRRKMSKEARAT
jgi:hypothetical protein